MKLVALATASIFVLTSLLFQPVAAPTGEWRLLNPTEYTATPASNLNGLFMINGGTSGLNSGNGWAVGDNGLIFFWNGFSWMKANSPTPCRLDDVNFGGPLNPVQNGVQSSSGWAVGGQVAAGPCLSSDAVSLYWNGISWQSYPVPNLGMPAEMKSVFLARSATSTTDNVIAVGAGFDSSGGEIWIWNGIPGSGGGWTEQLGAPFPTANNLNSVYMTQQYLSTCTGSGIQGVAVGDAGTILTFCGTWSLVTPAPTASNLNGVAMSSPTRGWAVGDSCTILSTNNGLLWSPYTLSTPCFDPTVNLRSIVLLSSSEGWAVGSSDASGHPTVLHGTSLDSTPLWAQIPVNLVTPTGLPSGVGLNSVKFATSGGNIWAVGASGVAAFCQSNCSSQNSAVWSTTTSPLTGNTAAQLNAVFMDSDDDGWAVGSDIAGGPYLMRWNGYAWTRALSVSAPPLPLYGVYMQGGSNAWAVGGGTPGVGPASTLYFNGNSWQQVVPDACTCQLRSVFMVSGSEAWAVGTGGKIMHSVTTGGTFSGYANTGAPAADLYTVFFDSSTSGWAGGISGGTPVIIHTILTNNPPDNWAAGIFFNPGGLPNGYTIRSLFFQDATHGWAAASSNLLLPTQILYWNGISWTLVSPTVTNPNDDLFAISVTGGTPATEGWAVGQDSVTKFPITLHYDGNSWSEKSLSPTIPVTGSLLGLYLRSSTNGLAVGTLVNANANTLALVLHLDPPGATGGGGGGGGGGGTTVITTVATTQTSSTSTQQTSSAGTTTSETSQQTTQVVTTIQVVTTTSQEMSTSTAVVETTSLSQNTLTLPAVPGFPVESIIAGIAIGLTALFVIRNRRASRT